MLRLERNVVLLNGSIDHCTCPNRVAILVGLLTPSKSNVLDDRNSRKNTDASKEVESLGGQKKAEEERCSKGVRVQINILPRQEGMACGDIICQAIPKTN